MRPGRYKSGILRFWDMKVAAFGRLARNVAAEVRKPKAQCGEVHFLDAVQVEQLAEAIRGPYGAILLFAAYTGLRPCELTALRVGRVDLLAGTARVCEAAAEVDGRLEWGGVKTHEARTVRLRAVRAELAAQLATRPHDADALVFAAPRGGRAALGRPRRGAAQRICWSGP